jgi:sec-independent protein translocase protein TatA
MSGGEIFVIVVAVLLVFGTKRLPEIARGLGKGFREFKKATDEIKKEITETDITKDIRDINNQINK